MGWWSNAFDNLADNVALVTAAAEDAIDPRNWVSGNAPNTAAALEAERARKENRPVDPNKAVALAEGGLAKVTGAARLTAQEIERKAGDVVDAGAKAAGGALDALTNPWVLGGIGLVVVLIVAAPYVSAVTKVVK